MAVENGPPKAQIIRPISWNSLRADEAEREIRRRIEVVSPIIRDHTYDRIEERGDERLLDSDVLRILREGSVRQQPTRVLHTAHLVMSL